MSEKLSNFIIVVCKTLMLLCVLAMIFFSVSFFITSVHRQRVLREKLEHYREVDRLLKHKIDSINNK